MASKARSKARSSLREFDLINELRRRHGRDNPSIVRGIGDDAAVIAPPAGRHLVLTTDLLAERIHFDLRTASFEDVGYKAATANLSDIAAMGGTPQYLLVSLAIPRTGTASHVSRLYQGMMAACRPHGVRLIGGDTSASKTGWFINITLVGSVASGHALMRSGARIGNRIYVTGTLGDSMAGLELLKGQGPGRRTSRGSLPDGHRRLLIRRHLRPSARITIGQWLSTHRLATAAIDVSDGLSGDLRHICEESHVGAEIELAALPISAACRAFAAATHLEAASIALAGGEDYELLFTTPARLGPQLEREAAKRGIRITRIGTITPAPIGMRTVTADGRRHPLPVTSYEHFRSET